jgi:uncharacterized protein (DUF169 family)
VIDRNWRTLARDLAAVLHPTAPPVAITFSASAPAGVEAHGGPIPPPLPDGRTGRVPAGCVFWLQATDRTFTTAPADHGNCSVGRLTHGLASIDDIAGNDDVATLLGSGWVTEDVLPRIPVVTERPGAITYGPLADTPAEVDPDVVLVRLTAKSLMVLRAAYPDLAVEGKPQCHIVAMAKEHATLAASVGCMLSRVRTGMPSTEVTCAIPAGRLLEVIDRVRATALADATVAAYAAEDARRFI